MYRSAESPYFIPELNIQYVNYTENFKNSMNFTTRDMPIFISPYV